MQNSLSTAMILLRGLCNKLLLGKMLGKQKLFQKMDFHRKISDEGCLEKFPGKNGSREILLWPFRIEKLVK